MSVDDAMALDERRGLERRVEMLEKDVRILDSRTAVMDALIKGLVSTMDSRHKAFERGQELILERLNRFVAPEIIMERHDELVKVAGRVRVLEDARSRMAGVLWFMLTILGTAGGLVTLVKAIKGP